MIEISLLFVCLTVGKIFPYDQILMMLLIPGGLHWLTYSFFYFGQPSMKESNSNFLSGIIALGVGHNMSCLAEVCALHVHF